jgi:thioredoxin
MANVLEVTKETFEGEVLQYAVPVLVDLYDPWCGPCRLMGPVLEQVAGLAGDRVKIVQINTDEQPELAAAFGVRSIPMLALVHGSKVIDTRVGFTPAKSVLAMIDAAAPLSV